MLLYPVKKGKIFLGVVFNLDKHYESGSHWVALFAKLNVGKIYYFDSYGYEPSKEVVTLMKRLKQQCKNLGIENPEIKINNVRHQRKGSECGVYSINFILRLLRGDTFEEITNNITTDSDINRCRSVYFQ